MEDKQGNSENTKKATQVKSKAQSQKKEKKLFKHSRYSDLKGLSPRDRRVIGMMYPNEEYEIEQWDALLANIVNFK